MSVQPIQTNAMKSIIKGQVSAPQISMQEKIQPSVPMQIKAPREKTKFTDIFEKIKSPADMHDTITVPRIVFKGYLGFVVGTGLMTIGAFIKNNKILSTALHAAGTLATIYGTYAFVKPYIIKGKDRRQVQEDEK